MEDSKPSTNNKRINPCGRFVLKAQARVFVYRLYLYFNRENNNSGPLKSLRKVTERVADALEISRKTVSRILKETRSGEAVKTPAKKKPRQSPKTGLDTWNECAVRNLIYAFYERKEWPTRASLLYSLKKANLFHGEKSSLSRILHQLNFEWRKINKRKCLLEKSDIVSARCKFLRKIRSCVLESVIFVGETCINTERKKSHARDCYTKLIVTHAGSAKGFVPNCCSILKSQGTGDYHQELDADTFKKWFIKLLQNIPQNSLIVMDNSPHHSVLNDKGPTAVWRKEEIQCWLTAKNIEWTAEMLKGDLVELAITHKSRIVQYELDELAQEKGHSVCRIPPNHCELNPIELIWPQIKEKVAAAAKFSDIESLTQSAVETITSENWERAVKQTAETIELAWDKERTVEQNVEEMISIVRECLSSWQSDSDSEDTDDEELEDKDMEGDEEEEEEQEEDEEEELMEWEASCKEGERKLVKIEPGIDGKTLVNTTRELDVGEHEPPENNCNINIIKEEVSRTSPDDRRIDTDPLQEEDFEKPLLFQCDMTSNAEPASTNSSTNINIKIEPPDSPSHDNNTVSTTSNYNIQCIIEETPIEIKSEPFVEQALPKSEVITRMQVLSEQVESLNKIRQQHEWEMSTLENPTLRERFQDVLDNLLTELINKQQEYEDLKSILQQYQ